MFLKVIQVIIIVEILKTKNQKGNNNMIMVRVVTSIITKINSPPSPKKILKKMIKSEAVARMGLLVDLAITS